MMNWSACLAVLCFLCTCVFSASSPLTATYFMFIASIQLPFAYVFRNDMPILMHVCGFFLRAHASQKRAETESDSVVAMCFSNLNVQQ